MSTIINATTTNGVVIQPDNSGSLVLQTNSGTTALTIDTSQNATFAGTLTATGKLVASSMPTGSVLQVVQVSYNTEFSTTSNTFADIGLSASITPSSSSNKILVFYSIGYLIQDTNLAGIQLLRGATILQSSIRAAASVGHASYMHNEYLDSPATTSSTTYKIQSNKNTGNAFVTCWNAQQPSTITLMEIKA
jgi:hypothetical protein